MMDKVSNNNLLVVGGEIVNSSKEELSLQNKRWSRKELWADDLVFKSQWAIFHFFSRSNIKVYISVTIIVGFGYTTLKFIYHTIRKVLQQRVFCSVKYWTVSSDFETQSLVCNSLV